MDLKKDFTSLNMKEVAKMVYAVKVTPLDNYNIIVEFNTGEIKIYNCYPLFSIPLFAKLKDKKFFMTAHIDETGLVCWDNATDIPPDELYDNSVLLGKFPARIFWKEFTQVKKSNDGFEYKEKTAKLENVISSINGI